MVMEKFVFFFAVKWLYCTFCWGIKLAFSVSFGYCYSPLLS